MTADVFSAYERGLDALLERLGREHPRYPEALTLQLRMLENIAQTRRYGDTETRRADRSQIIDGLNHLAQSAGLEVTFNQLCVSTKPMCLESGPKVMTVDVPDVYSFLGAQDESEPKHYKRLRDGQEATLLSMVSGLPGACLIDRTCITSRQFCDFVNDLLDREEARISHRATDGVKMCLDIRNRPLVLDSLDCWQRGPASQQPWLYAASPWGMTVSNGRWQPVPGADSLPATHITWFGAALYGAWAHKEWPADETNLGRYLPSAEWWRAAATWDPSTGSWRRYPWGDHWERERVNYAGFWSGDEIETLSDWQRLWALKPSVYRATRPLPVDSLEIGSSAIGCFQLLGNVWEWCSDSVSGRVGASRVIKGGACFSPKEYCRSDWSSSWPEVQSDAYVGFRCSCPLTW